MSIEKAAFMNRKIVIAILILLSIIGIAAATIDYQLTPQYIYNEIHYNPNYNSGQYANVFGEAIEMIESGTANSVAQFAEAIGTGGGSVWGSNFVGYTNSASGNTAIAQELDYGNLVAGYPNNHAYGLLIYAHGNYPTDTAISIDAVGNTWPVNGVYVNHAQNGLYIDAGVTTPITLNGLHGSGNALLCINSIGQVYRGTATSC